MPCRIAGEAHRVDQLVVDIHDEADGPDADAREDSRPERGALCRVKPFFFCCHGLKYIRIP